MRQDVVSGGFTTFLRFFPVNTNVYILRNKYEK